MKVNVLDGTFFGLGMGFASTVTVVPLFVDTLTDSTTLIGLIASVHLVGWQLPQILTASRVAGLKIYRPMVLGMTLHERWPFLALAFVALLIPVLGSTVSLILTFILLCWQALGGGFTATAWQSMIGKIMPLNWRGTFWGLQSAAASLMMAFGAYVAGIILAEVSYPNNFALCFLLTTVAMVLSWYFIYLTREPSVEPTVSEHKREITWAGMMSLLREDPNLRSYILARALAQFGWMAVAFYTIYGVRHFGMDEVTAGLLTGLLTLTQAVANPALGWLGDRIGHRQVFSIGMVLMAFSALAALFGPTIGWLYVAFALAGFGQAAIWTVAMAFTLEFGRDGEKPYYIGLTNTITAPATLVAPIIGGALADLFGFGVTFGVAAAAALVTVVVLMGWVRDPKVYYGVPAETVS
jgi:MFS family permease